MKLSLGKRRKKDRGGLRRPDVCLSLDCRNLEEIVDELEKFADYCQVVEWCVDRMDDAEKYVKEDVVGMVKNIRALCPGKKVMIDYGAHGETANKIRRWAMSCADMIDVDFLDPAAAQLVKEAKRKRVKTVLSFQKFDGMMTPEEISEQFLRMERLDGTILKIACAAEKEQDTYAMLEGAAAYTRLKKHKPIVAIAMGEEGQASRVCAGDFGSVMTYACGSRPTAPGQFNARELAKYLDTYYGEK